jgi:hypothetical protein
MISPQLSWSAVLRDNGQAGAERRLLEARVRKLEQELDLMEEETRTEIESLRLRVTVAARKLALARRRADLAARNRTLIAARFEHSLESPAALFQAEQEEIAARAQVTRAVSEASAGYFTVLAVCGLNDRPAVERTRLLFASTAGKAE